MSERSFLFTNIGTSTKADSSGDLTLVKSTSKNKVNKSTPVCNLKILIVEDEKPLSKVLSLKLTKMGFETSIVSNGKEALDAISKTKFDLVLLDLVMPVMGGFAFLETINENKIKLPIIVLSNLSQPEDEAKAKKLGAIAFFIKSDTPIAEIISYICTLLRVT